VRDSINTSSIHLDVLSEYRRIVSLLVAHAYKNLKQNENNGNGSPSEGVQG
jgi:Na+/phosphate symporter